MCFGTFDLLHPGHDAYVRQAASFGRRGKAKNEVIVVVARDRTVVEVKGQLPLTNEQDRRARVEAHPLVTKAILGKEGDKYAVIEDEAPDVLFLGYDQQAFTERLESELVSRGLSIRVVRGEPFEPERYHTSILLGETDEEDAWQEDEEEAGLPL